MIRKIHLLLGMFLTPWVIMYAASTIAMQHRDLFTGSTKRIEPKYEIVREEALSLDLRSSENSQVVASQVLEYLDLEGSHRLLGNWEEGHLEILRNRPIGSYRITVDANAKRMTVEKQGFGMSYFLEMLHRRSKFNQPYWANDAWAVIVDLFIVAILSWAFTGLWLWWKMKPTRVLGAICVFLGSALFAFLVSTI